MIKTSINFQVSIIMPVYNAEEYLLEAVESAVNLEEVGEIILIEDGSPDHALELAQFLTEKYDKIRLLRHPNGENRGAGASRNLGIINALYDYIAFLDADDKYLNYRFAKEKMEYVSNEFEGMYHTSGYIGSDKLMKLKKDVSGPEVFTYLLRQGWGTIHTNCLTVRKDLLLKSGLFNERLRLHQDTELWLRLASNINIIPGITNEPVSLIREHDENRITSANKSSKRLLWKEIFKKHLLNSKIALGNKLYILKVNLALLK